MRRLILILIIIVIALGGVYMFRNFRRLGQARRGSFLSSITDRLKTRFPVLPKVSKPPTAVTSKPSPSEGSAFSNPFGVMFANAEKVKIAKDLGAAYYRPLSVFVSKWNGTCVECDNAAALGLKLILIVRNNGGPQIPTTPPTDLNAYKKTLGEIIDKYRPAVLVVENEENSEAIFYSGTPQEYHIQLKAACEVAHQKGIKCANGGLVSSLVALLTTEDYMSKGEEAKANDFLIKSLGPKLESQFGSGMTAAQVLRNPKVSKQIEKGQALLSGYQQTGADYINFHWYIADTETLETASTFMSTSSGGMPVIINEVGQQKNMDPAQVTSVMQKIVDLRIPVAIWFSVDIQGYGGAKSLADENGNLRPNGEAFKDFIQTTF